MCRGTFFLQVDNFDQNMAERNPELPHKIFIMETAWREPREEREAGRTKNGCDAENMEDQKAENLLNLALSVPEETRERTEELNVGYDRAERTWEIIVKYHGELENTLRARFPDVSGTYLLNGFAILRVPEREVQRVIALPEIEYAEKPKRLFFALNRARAASCFLSVQTGNDGLTGKGVLVAVIDSGIDIFHEDFRNEDGSTRILYLDDQITGRTYEKWEIDEIIQGVHDADGRSGLSLDTSGHGTAVAGIAAGNGRASGGLYRGAAYESELMIVRLGIPDAAGFPRTTELMRGMDFAVRKALELGCPMAVNLSFGNTYGSHDGGGLLERYLDFLAQMGRFVFVTGSGNEGDSGGHGRPVIVPGEITEVRLSVGTYETGFGVQIWKNYEDGMRIFLRDPSGQTEVELVPVRGPDRIRIGEIELLIYYGEPSPFNAAQEIYIEFMPEETYVESGIWTFRFLGTGDEETAVDLWLPSSAAVGRDTAFLEPSPDTTLTIPSTAFRPITVGAYDSRTGIYASFSGRGDTRIYQAQKPDLAAPGVGIMAPDRDGGYSPVTGTSFAAPLVTGAAALLMEWGIVRGNDPYLYGEKVKAYLRKGAKRLPSELVYPNPRLGYGALCVSESLP